MGWTVSACFRPLHALMAAPALLFLFTMAVMLFRPADYRFHSYDRFAFVLLIFVVLLRSWTMRIPVRIAGPVIWPMSGLLLLALYDALSQPYDPETWGVLAAKWLVPLGLYVLAGHIFEDASLPASVRSLRAAGAELFVRDRNPVHGGSYRTSSSRATFWTKAWAFTPTAPAVPFCKPWPTGSL